MIAYAKDEIIPVTRIARHLSEILNNLRNGKLKKVAIAKNNRLESVILPIDEYEKLQEVYDFFEHIDIYQKVKDRDNIDIEGFIPLEQVLEENE